MKNKKLFGKEEKERSAEWKEKTVGRERGENEKCRGERKVYREGMRREKEEHRCRKEKERSIRKKVKSTWRERGEKERSTG